MTPQHDLVIRRGTVVDGNGGEPFDADIAISGGKIAALGGVPGTGREEIDAKGLLVTPGFIDPHTHYDAQVTWSERISPSSQNGVTTLLIGNCGVGFAPCRPVERDFLIKLMEGVEDIPDSVLRTGIPWQWESFTDFMNFLARRQYDVDLCTQVPHAALRLFVMGTRGGDGGEASPADLAEIERLTAEAARQGAFGFSTSRTRNHRTLDGRLMPTLAASEGELLAAGRGLQAAGSGWLQVIADFDDKIEAEFAMLRRVVEHCGRPMVITVLERDAKPREWRDLLTLIARARADGLPIRGQVIGRATGILMGFELSRHPFLGCPSWRKLAELPFAEQVKALHDPTLRAALISEPCQSAELEKLARTWERVFPLGDPPNYEPAYSDSIAARAAATGVSPAALAYDLLLERDGKAILYRPMSNYARGNLDSAREMIAHPDTLVGQSDGGAHVAMICDASAPTHLLSYWTRDRASGRFSVPWAVKRLTADNADALGLADRGRVAIGLRADLNIIDYAALELERPRIVYDFPAGGRRLIQESRGYVATLLGGVPTYRDGRSMGTLPGRLVRSRATR